MMDDLRQRYLELVQRGQILAFKDAMGECDVEQLDEFDVDLDSGTVFDIRSIVYVPMTEWEKVSKEFEYSHGHVGKSLA